MDFFSDFSMTIDGAAARTVRQMDVVNPATGTPFSTAPVAEADDLDRAVAAARDALPRWSAFDIDARRAALIALGDAIDAECDNFTRLFVAEQGRPAPMARHEIMISAQWLRDVAAQELPVQIVEDSPERRVEVHRMPIGVVAAIVPWNLPVMLSIWKIAPALLAGNTMVLKPSPYTPLCALKLGELSRDILPPGVLNIISGEDALGPMMTAHPGFHKISFTGSTATGKRVMEAAGRDLKRVTLELGGNDAAIVLPDVNIEEVAPQLFFSAFFNSAQACIATKRLYIHEQIYDELRDRLHAIAKDTVVGDGAQPGVEYGPLQNAAQFSRVRALVDDARAHQLTLLEGRPVPEQGFFVPITLVDNPPETSAVVAEEAFGPVLPLLKFKDIDDVIARANDSDYGLGGSVWSSDIALATRIAARLNTGTVWINSSLECGAHIPFAGAKQSGIGIENSEAGLLEFTQSKTILIRKRAPAPL